MSENLFFLFFFNKKSLKKVKITFEALNQLDCSFYNNGSRLGIQYHHVIEHYY